MIVAFQALSLLSVVNRRKEADAESKMKERLESA
jgi:hypothetical protein